MDSEDLAFLPRVVDDLYAREALRVAGTILVDEFRAAILHGAAGKHATDLVPPAFRAAVNEHLALDFYAAAVALMARLSAGAPAGCAAEEIVSVNLISDASAWLEGRVDAGEITESEFKAAVEELGGCLYEFYGDDDVINLFEMAEPADAAVAGHNPVNQYLGVVDHASNPGFSHLVVPPKRVTCTCDSIVWPTTTIARSTTRELPCGFASKGRLSKNSSRTVNGT